MHQVDPGLGLLPADVGERPGHRDVVVVGVGDQRGRAAGDRAAGSARRAARAVAVTAVVAGHADERRPRPLVSVGRTPSHDQRRSRRSPGGCTRTGSAVDQVRQALGAGRLERASRSSSWSWASSVSRMTSRWQAASRGRRSSRRSRSARSLVGGQPGRRLELVVPPLDQQPPAGLRSGSTSGARTSSARRVGGAKITASRPGCPRGPSAWATQGPGDRGILGEPEEVQQEDPVGPEGADDAERRGRRRGGRPRPTPAAASEVKLSERLALRIRRWVRESTGSGLAASRSSPPRRRRGGRTAEQTWVPQIWEPASLRRPVTAWTSRPPSVLGGLTLGAHGRGQRLFDDAGDDDAARRPAQRGQHRRPEDDDRDRVGDRPAGVERAGRRDQRVDEEPVQVLRAAGRRARTPARCGRAPRCRARTATTRG